MYIVQPSNLPLKIIELELICLKLQEKFIIGKYTVVATDRLCKVF